MRSLAHTVTVFGVMLHIIFNTHRLNLIIMLGENSLYVLYEFIVYALFSTRIDILILYAQLRQPCTQRKEVAPPIFELQKLTTPVLTLC